MAVGEVFEHEMPGEALLVEILVEAARHQLRRHFGHELGVVGHLVAAGDPRGHVGQQERAPAHRPADPSGDAGQGQHQDGQDVATDVDPQVVAGAPERTAERPDLGPA